MREAIVQIVHHLDRLRPRPVAREDARCGIGHPCTLAEPHQHRAMALRTERVGTGTWNNSFRARRGASARDGLFLKPASRWSGGTSACRFVWAVLRTGSLPDARCDTLRRSPWTAYWQPKRIQRPPAPYDTSCIRRSSSSDGLCEDASSRSTTGAAWIFSGIHMAESALAAELFFMTGGAVVVRRTECIGCLGAVRGGMAVLACHRRTFDVQLVQELQMLAVIVLGPFRPLQRAIGNCGHQGRHDDGKEDEIYKIMPSLHIRP